MELWDSKEAASYRTEVEARDCQMAESRTFLNKVFAGKVAPLVAAFVEREEVSPQEIVELKRILEELDE